MSMQEPQTSSQSWLKPGYFVDLKDKHNQWRVALLLTVTPTHIKARFDGLSSKYDEVTYFNNQTYLISSANIKPFRSVVRGYTGNPEVPAVREHYTFSQSMQKEQYQIQIDDYLENMYKKSQFQIIQYIRGTHYFWVDHLLTLYYKNINQIGLAYQYFFKHFNLMIKYFKDMLSCDSIDSWFNGDATVQLGQTAQACRAFAQSYYQIMEATCLIMENSQRTKSFYKFNNNLIAQFISGNQSHADFLAEYLNGFDMYQLIQDLLDKMLEDNQSKIKLSFLASFTRIFYIVDRTVKDKDKRKQVTVKMCQIILRQCAKMNEIFIKQQQVQIQKMYKLVKIFIQKYNIKAEILSNYQLINIKCWKNMILSQKLQRKLKGINKLKIYYSLVSSVHKRQSYLVYNSKQVVQKQFRNQQIIKAIFCQNQHHQIIRKGCQFIQDIYREGGVSANQLEIIWNSCRHRVEAVRKALYSFFQSLAKQLKVNDLKYMVNIIIEQKIVEQIDKHFFYSFFKQVLDSAKQDKIAILKRLFQYAEQRTIQNKQQMKQFAQLLILPKSQKFKFVSYFINKFVQIIPNQSNNPVSIFYLRLTNLIYQLSTTKEFELDQSCFNIIYQYLVVTLSSKVRKDDSQYMVKRQKIAYSLKLLENFSVDEFKFQINVFKNIWDLFNQQQNVQLRELQFLPWIIEISQAGILQIEKQCINPCLQDKNLKHQIFDQILKNHEHIDYVNLSEMQFKIFRKFLIQVNIDQNNLMTEIQFLTGIHYFRIKDKADNFNGLKQLWDIMINCRNFNVTKKAITLIKQLYLNYKFAVSSDFKCLRIQQLLKKIHKQILDGHKKSNIRIIRCMLYFVNQIVKRVKQTQKTPQQYKNYNHTIKSHKRTIKVVREEGETKNFQVNNKDTVKSLKNAICKQFNVPPYDLTLFKVTYNNKKIDDEGNDVFSEDASAGSSYTNSYTKNYFKHNYIRIQQLIQINHEVLHAPIQSLMLAQNEQKIIAKFKRNEVYQLLCKFISEKMGQVLIKILGDTQFFSKQSSQLAYHILVEVPSHLNSIQILTNLLNQLKLKAKGNAKLNLSNQSLNFRMYFCKNINRLSDQQFVEFTKEENSKILQDIFQQISKRIIQREEIQLIIQIINLAKRGFKKNLIPQDLLSAKDFIQCIINMIEFIIGPKSTQQFKKLQKSEQYQLNLQEQKVFNQCLSTLEIIHHKDKYKIIDSIIQNQNFQKLMVYLFRDQVKIQFASAFVYKIEQFLKYTVQQKGKLSQKTEQILCRVIFDVLYLNVIKQKYRRNSSFFKIIRDLIPVLSSHSIQQLFKSPIEGHKKSLTFWQICLKIMKKQSDFSNQQDGQNNFLNGHIHIMESLIRRNPQVVDLSLCKMVLYSCLCYNQNETIGDQIKCKTKNSIKAALSALFAICQCNEQFLKLIVYELRKYQQTEYWRNSQFWNVNLQLETKSQTGFVGLQNPGCICYLNSFTQTLFMNEQFRNKVIHFQMTNQNKNYSLLVQLKKLFLNLQFSNKKYLNPVPFTRTIRNNDDKPMIKLRQQMDIEEYSSILFDKIQKLLPKQEDFVKQIFGGAYSNDIISQQCKHFSQRQENFLSMQVDVKPNLQQSLKALVKGQILQGQNAYFCQQCNRKVKAIKRMSIKKLPNYLIICLKRFEYNFQIDQKIKVNAFCRFGQQLSLQPYSQQYLNGNIIQDQQSGKVEQAETESNNMPHQYFDYRLKGVIIHTGSSESGHYYTLIETEPGKWIEFNDSLVYEFDIQKLQQEAFGSDDPMNPKFKNAYMLIYQRKKKIEPKKMLQKMQAQQAITKNYSKQTLQIYHEIKKTNRQIETFNLMFSHQYLHFAKQIVSYVIESTSDGQIKRYDNKIQQELVKYYLQYCLFVRSRDINSGLFVQSLNKLDLLLEQEQFQSVIDYLIKEFSQNLLIQEFFFQVSFRDKAILLSNFMCKLILRRIKNKKQSEHIQVMKIVIKLVESIMSLIIYNGNCVNQLLFIIRSLAEEEWELFEYFQKMDIFDSIFSIMCGLNQSQKNKISRIQRLEQQVYRIIEQISNKDKDQSLMEQQNQKVYNQFQIKVVNRTGKCPLKQESPQQAWNYLYITYKRQSLICENVEQEFIQKQEINLINAALIFKRYNYQKQFCKLKDERLEHFIGECQGSKAATSLSLFLCQFMHNNQGITDRMLGIISKNIKKLNALKFRPYLILLYHIALHIDGLYWTRIINVMRILNDSLIQNKDYFSQIDILQQWTIKICITSELFAQKMARSEEGNELLNQLIQRLENNKRPSAQLLKKQKNPNFERWGYLNHGIVVSNDLQDYQRLQIDKRDYFQHIFQEKPMPSSLKNQKIVFQMLELSYGQLTHKAKVGQIMLYLHQKHWVRVLVKSYAFGKIKAIKLQKDMKKAIKNVMANEIGIINKESKANIVKIGGIQIDIGDEYIVGEQQFVIWDTEDRLKCLDHVEMPAPADLIRNQIKQQQIRQLKMNKQKQAQISSQNIKNKYENDSDVSYESNSGNS